MIRLNFLCIIWLKIENYFNTKHIFLLIFPGKRQGMHGKQTVSMICLGEWKKDRDKADTSYVKKILCNGTLECSKSLEEEKG